MLALNQAGRFIFAAIAIAVSMWLNKQEMERFRNATNAAGHSMFGGR